jgi:uncharacterized protein (TIGR00730 family)
MVWRPALEPESRSVSVKKSETAATPSEPLTPIGAEEALAPSVDPSELAASLLLAEADQDLLQRDELRHVRLALEYVKPELALSGRNTRSTIVLFGGTRIVRPAQAQQQVELLVQALADDPDSQSLQRRLKVARRIADKSRYYEVARRFAKTVSEYNKHAGSQHEWVIATGGGPGIMEAGNRGAFEAGCPSIGFNITLPREQMPNPYVSAGLSFRFRYFAIRKFHFLLRAKALVAFPGGYGTLDEIFDALCLIQTGKIMPMPVVLVGKDFWTRALNVEFLRDEGVIDPDDVGLIQYAETADDVFRVITDYYR